MILLVSHILGITASLNVYPTLNIACVLHSLYLHSTQTNYSTPYLHLYMKNLFFYIYVLHIFASSYKYLPSILTQFFPILHIFTFNWTAIVLCSLN